MTIESGHDPLDRERAPRPTTQPSPVAQPVPYHVARHGNHVEESPELLRWRADLLMDEMMMGGVDVSAADGNRTFSGVDAPIVQRPSLPSNGSHANGYSTNGYANGGHSRGYSNGGNPNNGNLTNGSTHPGARDADAHDRGYGSYAPTNGEHGHNGERSHAENGYTNGGYRNGHTHPDDSNHLAHATDVDGADNNGRGYPSPAANYQNTNSTARPDVVRPSGPRNFDMGNEHHGNARAAYDDYRQDAGQLDAEQPAIPTNYATTNYDSHTLASRTQDGARPTTDDVANGRYADDRYDTSYRERDTQGPTNGGYGTDYASSYTDEQNIRGIQPPRQYPTSSPNPTSPSPAARPERYGGQPPVDEGRTPPVNTATASRPMTDGAASSGNAEQAPRSDRLYAVEQQYEQFRREQSSHIEPVENKSTAAPPRSATRPPLPPVEPVRHPAAPARVTPPPPDEHTQWATVPDKWEYQDFGADPEQAEEDDFLSGAPPMLERRAVPESAVRHDPAQFVSAMSVMGNNKKRSTLLPRSTELDIDTLHREISDLHGEIAALLPVGNETSERARHLLDKAYSILQSDPSRSAEVEYYMQQVRTIVQRLRQSRQWSDLYRQRLHVYLLGWLGLSAMVLFARFFFQLDVEDMMMWLVGADADSWVIAHWATFVGTAGAGAFGGALGALYTMRKHARGEYSFFDRKYGLRGLILPVIGLMVGMVGYIIFGAIFALVGINPSHSLTAAIVPTVSAFAFGFSQESIYGTRG